MSHIVHILSLNHRDVGTDFLLARFNMHFQKRKFILDIYKIILQSLLLILESAFCSS